MASGGTKTHRTCDLCGLFWRERQGGELCPVCSNRHASDEARKENVALVKAINDYRSEHENPVPDYTMRRVTRDRMFALADLDRRKRRKRAVAIDAWALLGIESGKVFVSSLADLHEDPNEIPFVLDAVPAQVRVVVEEVLRGD